MTLKPEYLILHHVGKMPERFDYGRAVQIIRGWHTDPNRPGGPMIDIAYHKLFLPDGSVLQGRPDAVVGAHAFGANTASLGLLYVGDCDLAAPTWLAIRSIVNTAGVLCRRHNIPASRIIGHGDVARIWKKPEAATGCPGKYFTPLLPSIRQWVSEYAGVRA